MILEAFGHHAGVFELPKIDVFGVVAAQEKIKLAVVVVIEPNGGVGIHPAGQAGLFSDASEVLATVVVEKFRLAPFIDENIFEAIVVVISPNCAHGNSGFKRVQVSEAHFFGDILERAVVHISIERVRFALAAINYVDVIPAIAVEIYY